MAAQLDATAQNLTYHGNALYTAMDLPFLNNVDRAVLTRYLIGNLLPEDHISLHEIAIKIRNYNG